MVSYIRWKILMKDFIILQFFNNFLFLYLHQNKVIWKITQIMQFFKKLFNQQLLNNEKKIFSRTLL